MGKRSPSTFAAEVTSHPRLQFTITAETSALRVETGEIRGVLPSLKGA